MKMAKARMQIWAKLEEWRGKKTFAEMADELNKLGIATTIGRRWNEKGVRMFDYNYRKSFRIPLLSGKMPKPDRPKKAMMPTQMPLPLLAFPQVDTRPASKDAYDLLTMVAASNLTEKRKRAVITAMCAE